MTTSDVTAQSETTFNGVTFDLDNTFDLIAQAQGVLELMLAVRLDVPDVLVAAIAQKTSRLYFQAGIITVLAALTQEQIDEVAKLVPDVEVALKVIEKAKTA